MAKLTHLIRLASSMLLDFSFLPLDSFSKSSPIFKSTLITSATHLASPQHGLKRECGNIQDIPIMLEKLPLGGDEHRVCKRMPCIILSGRSTPLRCDARMVIHLPFFHESDASRKARRRKVGWHSTIRGVQSARARVCVAAKCVFCVSVLNMYTYISITYFGNCFIKQFKFSPDDLLMLAIRGNSIVRENI